MLGWWTLFLDLSNSSFLPFHHHNAWERKFWTVTIGNNEIKLSRSRLPSLCKLASSDQMSCPQEKFSSSTTSQSFQTSGTRRKASKGEKNNNQEKGSNQNSSAKLVFVSSSGNFVSSPDNFWQLEGFFHPRTVSVLPTKFSELENIRKGSGKLEGEKALLSLIKIFPLKNDMYVFVEIFWATLLPIYFSHFLNCYLLNWPFTTLIWN